MKIIFTLFAVILLTSCADLTLIERDIASDNFKKEKFYIGEVVLVDNKYLQKVVEIYPKSKGLTLDKIQTGNNAEGFPLIHYGRISKSIQTNCHRYDVCKNEFALLSAKNSVLVLDIFENDRAAISFVTDGQGEVSVVSVEDLVGNQ